MNIYSGTIQRGSQRARLLGYPTINIALTENGPSGIYAAIVRHGNNQYPAVAFADPGRGVLEAHIFEYDADIYGEEANIELLQKIRDAQEFKDDEALKSAIANDVARVRVYFKI